MAKEEMGSEFQVKLDGLKLPADAEARITVAIRKAVLSELAGLDLGGDLRIHPEFVLVGHRTRGLWLELTHRSP